MEKEILFLAIAITLFVSIDSKDKQVCNATSTKTNLMECANGKFGKIWAGCINQGSVRVRCPKDHIPCNDLAENGLEFSCFNDCQTHGGRKACMNEAEKLLVTSSGAAAEVHEDCLGDYELTGQSSNNKPVYQLFKYNKTNSGISGSVQKIPQDRYIYFTKNSNWMISEKEDIGTDIGWIHNEAGGEAPHMADQNRWVVSISDNNPIRHKYIGTSSDWYKDPTFKVVAIS